MNCIVVTGANSGIGLECVSQFLEENWQVIAISKNSNNLKLITHTNLEIYECDVCDYTKLTNIIATVANKHITINGLINNAGVAYYSELEKLQHMQIKKMIDINVQGFTNVLELILPIMHKNNNGTIINLSSLADRLPRPYSSVYAATKAYVKSLTDSLRLSNAKHNIRIMNLSPTNINTPLLQSIKKTKSGFIEVKEFVTIIKFMVNLPHSINVRDIVIAPTEYEG
ncbi:MAG: SDR family NAD(P)-dependent oxidoreductase [Burkholderiales bacterium]|nr:SDR family NAD(P)-dependent oxidoreductase [Burkholderiales bacterium]